MFVRLAVINVNYKIISSYKFIWRIGKKKKRKERERKRRRKKKQRENKTWPKIPKRKGKSKKTGLKIKS